MLSLDFAILLLQLPLYIRIVYTCVFPSDHVSTYFHLCTPGREHSDCTQWIFNIKTLSKETG